MQVNNKPIRLIDYNLLVDPDTGEKIPIQLNVVECHSFDFQKTWLKHLIHSFDEIDNRKEKLAFWIVEKLNKENQLIMTQKKIAELSGISYQTVNRTIRLLTKGSSAFLQKINSGAYTINPKFLFHGNHSNKIAICYQYIKREKD